MAKVVTGNKKLNILIIAALPRESSFAKRGKEEI